MREPLNILYYGDGGTGKTTNLAFMANLGRIVYVNAEAGIKARPLRELGVTVENVEVFPGPQERICFGDLENLHRQLKDELDQDPNCIVGVVWDSISEIHKALLDDVIQHQVQKASRAGRERDRFWIERGDYGVMTEQVRLLVRRFRDLPCHFGVAGLQRREQDDDGAVVYQPAVTPALQNDLVGWMDVVCHTGVGTVGDEPEYRGSFQPIGKFRGKDRYKALPRYLVDPTFERVYAYCISAIDVDHDKVMREAMEKRAKLEAERAEAEAGESGRNVEEE